ncbi:ketopantoate reductase family protein [Desulfosoma caldarium]|uniref:2-dehydropantoate 2-reductase n=1 Tax=Desulfosoma caldarium TaxID=610254 RepID=A0A3N1UUS8_9BACT|nr:2-dehydropantoate 2-reductase [Desulfosoma caldarium]ROQ93179.1 ketopantoate reductase [Desulfosoma caldarium]
MMHVLVVGAGAMGCLLGARFAMAGAHVLLLDVDVLHVEAIQRHGLRLIELNGDEKIVPIEASFAPVPSKLGADLVLVMVKSYATGEALRLVHSQSITPGTVFLTLQNGLGNAEKLADLVGPERVLVGVTAQGATKEGPGVVRHGGVGPTFFGSFSGFTPPNLEKIVNLFVASGLEASYRQDIDRLLWQKLCVNVGINAITALCGLTNGQIPAMPPARLLCEAAVREVLRVARAEGVRLDEDELDHVLAVAKATGSNRSSMRQDVEGRRPTEIEAINGAVVRYAQKHGLSAPINWTLTQLVKIKEGTYGHGTDA